MENLETVKAYVVRSNERPTVELYNIEDAYAVYQRRFDYGISSSLYVVLHSGATIWLR